MVLVTNPKSVSNGRVVTVVAFVRGLVEVQWLESGDPPYFLSPKELGQSGTCVKVKFPSGDIKSIYCPGVRSVEAMGLVQKAVGGGKASDTTTPTFWGASPYQV